MSERLTTWLTFGFFSLSAPVIFFAFMYMAFIPLAGIPALFQRDFDLALLVVAVVNVSFYGAIFYWASRLIAWVLMRLHRLLSICCLAALGLASIAITFMPLYGGCYGSCDHMSLWDFYRFEAGAI